MRSMLVYPVGVTPALRHAAALLQQKGVPLIDHPAPEITHLLLDVPSFAADGSLRSGEDAEIILERLPPRTIVAGGGLDHPALRDHKTLDLLKDPGYLAENAAITAHCALEKALPLLKTTLPDTPALVIGWGRIGKCLARLLRALDTPVAIAARKEADRAMARALGFRAVDFDSSLASYGLIFNTVPAPVFSGEQSWGVKIDLASQKGLPGEDVVWARGLPGTHAPHSSGKRIAEAFCRLCKEETP